MALKARISKEDHAALPEALRKEYVEKDGRFVLDVTPDGDFSLHSSENLKKAIENERQGSEELKKKLALFGDLDPNEAREAVKNKTVYKGGADERLTAAEAKWKADFDAAKAKHETERGGLQGYIRKTLVAAAIKDAKGNDRLLLPHVLPRVGVASKGDDFEVFIADESGKPVMTKVQGSAGNMTVAEYLASLRADDAFKGAFYSDQKPGNGSPPGGGGGGGGGPTTVARGDLKAAGASIEQIAAGTATVQ